RAADPFDGGLHRPRVLRARDAGAVQRGDAADEAVPGDEDRAAVHVPADLAGRAPLRVGPVRVALPGAAGADADAGLPELQPRGDLSAGREKAEDVKRGGWRPPLFTSSSPPLSSGSRG